MFWLLNFQADWKYSFQVLLNSDLGCKIPWNSTVWLGVRKREGRKSRWGGGGDLTGGSGGGRSPPQHK